MTKRRWKCHEGIDDKIFSIIKSNKDITTSGILVKLREEDVRATWKLINSYLIELEEAKKVIRVQIGDLHKINFWNIL